MPNDIKLHVEVEGEGLVHVHPETNTGQVIDPDSGKYLNQILNEKFTSGKISRSHASYKLDEASTATTVKSITVTGINDFDPSMQAISVHLNGEFLFDSEYITSVGAYGINIELKDRFLEPGDTVSVNVDKVVAVVSPTQQVSSVKIEKFNTVIGSESQTAIDFGSATFIPSKDKTMVFVQSEVLVEGLEYVVSDSGSVINLIDRTFPVGYKVHVIVFKAH